MDTHQRAQENLQELAVDPVFDQVGDIGYLYRVFGPRHDGIRALPHRASEVSVTPRVTYGRASTRVFLSSLLLFDPAGPAGNRVTVTVRADGRFRMSLPPGDYRLP
jgi:hypothetical protein